MKTKFAVKGMSCSACAQGIEKNLSKLDGVKSVEVSLMTETMIVEYDGGKIGAEDIIGHVGKLGYGASLYDSRDNQDKKKIDKVLIRFIVSLILLIPLMYFSMGAMINLPQPGNTASYLTELILAAVILAVNGKFFIGGTRAVINKSANMDTLVALSAGGAFLYSVVATIVYFSGARFSGRMFYESAAMVVTLVTLGKWLEDKSKRKTGREIEMLSKLVPQTVTAIVNDEERTVAVDDVKPGDYLLFRTGDYIAVDGEVIDGLAYIDKAAITGESLPVETGVGDEVVSGSILKSGYVTVVAAKVGADTLFSKIIESVKAAAASKAPVQKFADKVAGIFVPVVAVIALITFIIWIAVTKDAYRSFNYAISVLVISCPCALGLATPVAVMATTGKAASFGILYKDAEAIQKVQNINCVLLDKTATITKGRPKVVAAEFFGREDRAKSIASAIEAKSTHPLAVCIKEFTGDSDLICDGYEYVVGKGSVAKIGGKKYYLGNDKLVADLGIDTAEFQNKYAQNGYTTVYLAADKKLSAVFAIADTIKADSVEAINALNANNIQTVMVTGDNKGAAQHIAMQANIKDYVAEVLPDGKVDVVKRYMGKGSIVAMVGDGINDSPAIKTADVGIAVGTGTDIAIDSADIVIAGGSLKGILDSILLGKKSNNIIKGNLFWAFFYNVTAIPLAAGALSKVGLSLTPSIAAVCMCLSSLFVVFNALRITRYKSYFGKVSGGACVDRCDKTVKIENAAAHKIIGDNKGKGKLRMITVYVDGMMCMHCVKHVKDALAAIDGVVDVNVDLETKKVDITSNKAVSIEAVEEAVTAAGYSLIKK